LRESTTWGSCAESLSETKGLSNWEVSLDHDKGSTLDWLFTVNDTSALSKATVNSTYCIVGALNFDQEDGLLEAGLSGKFWSEEHTSGSWGNLTTTSVNSISVECNILDVKANTSHVFISQNTLFGGPLEGCLAGVLNFSHELALLSNIN
jgi:hypothetical protein